MIIGIENVNVEIADTVQGAIPWAHSISLHWPGNERLKLENRM